MSDADIIESTLQSRIVRNAIGSAGKRIIKSNNSEPAKDESGNFLDWVWNSGKKFAGWLVEKWNGLVKGLGALGAIWGRIVQTAQFIWNFDWQQTDKSLDEQIQGSFNRLGGLLGGTLGKQFGYLMCGVLPGTITFVFNEALGAHILRNVSREMAEEFVSDVSQLIRATFDTAIQAIIIWSFKNARKLIKANNALVQRLFGDKTADAVKAWGNEGNKPWSFAKAVEEKVEKIPNKFLKNFTEEFLEEAWEGCVEAGYVVANSVENFVAEQALAKAAKDEEILGKERFVEIIPDRSNDNERIILAGNENILKNTIVHTLTQYQLLENRDVGTIIGQPTDDYLRAKPQSIRLVIVFKNIERPYQRVIDGNRIVEATYAIPDVRRSKCDWETIKKACQGGGSYTWGRFKVTAQLNNGRQMQILGSSHDEAEDLLKVLLEFSTAKMLTSKPNYGEDRREDNDGKYLKQPTRMYPHYFSILNQYKVPGAQGSGVSLLSGKHIRRKDRIMLWTDSEPPDAAERIAEMLKTPGADNQLKI